MVHADPASAFPFFIPTEERQLSSTERGVVELIVSNEVPELRVQLNGLRVVGRCGCGACPTVFFQPHVAGEREHEIASYSGNDATGGIVGVLLWQKNGRLSQLEFYSVDGHDPWAIPEASTLGRF
jgi:hypothetical protein